MRKVRMRMRRLRKMRRKRRCPLDGFGADSNRKSVAAVTKIEGKEESKVETFLMRMNRSNTQADTQSQTLARCCVKD